MNRSDNERVIDLTLGELREFIESIIEGKMQRAELKGYGELAKYLRCSERTARRMVEDGRIPSQAIARKITNGLIWFNIEYLQQWKR